MVFHSSDGRATVASKECNWCSAVCPKSANWRRVWSLGTTIAPLKDISDYLGGENYVTGSVIVHALRKLEKFLICTSDDPMFITSFKKAFSSYFDLNIRVPPVLKACSLLDPRFKRLKGTNNSVYLINLDLYCVFFYLYYCVVSFALAYSE